ncbi:MAG: hypothetical protein AAGC60_17050 [Acidobacteriota bacterium]
MDPRIAKHSAVPCVVAVALLALCLCLGVAPALAELPQSGRIYNDGGVIEPVLSALSGTEIRIPNTDQSVDGVEQSTIHGQAVWSSALGATSLLGHDIDHVASPNDDMRTALQAMVGASDAGDAAGLQAAAGDLMNILQGTTEGRVYDGFSMLNYNRGAITPQHVPGEYKTKIARDSGETFVSPYDGEERRIWEVDIAMLYYDGQIDSDTFFVLFPYGHHDDDTLRVNYRIYSLVQEDFSPTLVMLDKRRALNTVQFPFKGFDSVWLAFEPGEVVDVTIDYPPVRQIRGVYTWGWREHPPRIQFMQPLYEIRNARTGEIELDPQSLSYLYRNRVELTLDTIGEAAPEKKMYRVAEAALAGATPEVIYRWLTLPDEGPRGTWIDWSDLVKNQNQLPPEAWDALAQEGLQPGEYGDYQMVSVFLNNEMYGEGPFTSEIRVWQQGDEFRVKLINLDAHSHYFRNVDFGPRLHDDILNCCGGGETSFEIMNFKPSYGAPKVAEMQWRAGWGFRPHYDVIQQQGVFSRGRDRVGLAPYTGGLGGSHWGYQYSKEARGGDFRFSPPPFVITDHDHPAPYPLRDLDGEAGLVIGQFTEGYGETQMCPNDPYPGFCTTDFGPYNPNGTLNWPAPNDPTVPKTELRFPPFLRNPAQGQAGAGDIIPPTGAWRPFLWINPYNGTLYVDPDDPSKGYWADLTYAHGAPVPAGGMRTATVELPRASGQVFYQFDDLFHDNSIFSPHPVFGGFGQTVETDEVVRLDAMMRRGSLRLRGEVEADFTGGTVSYVSVHEGGATDGVCDGTQLGAAPVGSDGRFVFRHAAPGLAAGDTLCVQSPVGASRELTIAP